MESIVTVSAGDITLVKPKAGARNKALMKAETAEGLKQTVMMVELLPYCIKEHPFGQQNLRNALENLEIEEYDAIINALADLIRPDGDAVKKSEKPSGTESETAQP